MGTAARDIVTIVQRAIAQSGVDMTGKPEDIPQDVWEAAIKCAETALRNLDGDYGDMTVEITSIARAITAERERCAQVADTYFMRWENDGSAYWLERRMHSEGIANAIRK